MLRNIFIALAVVIAIPFVTALFIKQGYSVTTSITIDRPVAEVFEYVKYLKNQDHFSVWAKVDPNMTKSYRGVDGNVGFVSAWASDNPEVGAGEQEIVGIDEGKRLDFELRFFTPFKATDPAYMTTQAIGEHQTLVTWGFSGHMEYPKNLMLLFVDFETMIGNDLNQGLMALKSILESES